MSEWIDKNLESLPEEALEGVNGGLTSVTIPSDVIKGHDSDCRLIRVCVDVDNDDRQHQGTLYIPPR